MANLQVRNVPEPLHDRLRNLAREKNRTMSSVVLTAIEREVERLEFYRRMSEAPTTELGIDAATLIREERALREAELDWTGTS